MASLLMVLMSIALFAVFVYGGINYLNIDQFKKQEKINIIETGFLNLETNFSIYRNQKDYFLPTTNWINEIESIGQSIPDLETGYTWEYNKVGNTYYFCITSNTVDEIYYNAMLDIAAQRNIAFVNTSCGSNELTTPMSNPSAFPTTAALTYWIKR